jgi:small ligand-binding sensory domain FIST
VYSRIVPERLQYYHERVIAAATGLSRSGAAEAVRIARERLGTEPAASLVFRCSVPPGPATAGCEGGGVLTEEGEVEFEPAAAALLVSGCGARALRGADAFELGRSAAGAAAAVLLPPPEPFDLGLFRESFEGAVVGGVSTGGPATGLALSGVRVETVVTQCAEPVGGVHLITEADGNVILRLGGKTPLDVLKEVRKRDLLAGIAPVVRKPELGRGDFLIRNIMGIDRESGAVAVAMRVAPGMKFAFHHRDGAAARDDFEERLGRVSIRPAFGLYFNCMGRGRGLYGRPGVDVELIRARLGEFPLCGFHGNGEIVGDTLHNYTGVLALFA